MNLDRIVIKAVAVLAAAVMVAVYAPSVYRVAIDSGEPRFIAAAYPFGLLGAVVAGATALAVPRGPVRGRVAAAALLVLGVGGFVGCKVLDLYATGADGVVGVATAVLLPVIMGGIVLAGLYTVEARRSE